MATPTRLAPLGPGRAHRVTDAGARSREVGGCHLAPQARFEQASDGLNLLQCHRLARPGRAQDDVVESCKPAQGRGCLVETLRDGLHQVLLDPQVPGDRPRPCRSTAAGTSWTT